MYLIYNMKKPLSIGFNKKVYFDLLYKSEKETLSFGKHNATFEVLRLGF